MITIDLEKELLSQNKKLLAPQELLLVREYDQQTELAENDALKRVGMHRAIEQGRALKSRAEALRQETLRFNQEKVFHISQIEKTCNKYHLRFLPSRIYEGAVDSKLPDKITTFEVAYGVQLSGGRLSYSGFLDRYVGADNTNAFIMAPASSFKLQEKPKDPLFFYKINDEYYYLIHKWGNDLNISRRFIRLFSSVVFCTALIVCAIGSAISILHIGAGIGVGSFVAVALTLWNLIEFDDQIRFVKKNNWDSPYK
jgi:hypothetical protein